MAYNEKHQTAKRLFEVEGMSKAAIARQLNISPQSVGKWAKADEWGVQGAAGEPQVGVVDPAPIAAEDFPAEDQIHVSGSYVSDAPTVSVPPSSVVELETEIIALQAKNTELVEENARLNPTIDIHEMLENRVAWLTTNTPDGDRYWTNRAEREWSEMTRARIRDGLEPFRIKDEPEMFQETIDTLKAKEAASFDAEPDEPASRKIKLAIYRGGKNAQDSENGWLTIEQIPLEGQINNTAGSLADGIIRYTRKGFKITDPFLCPRAGCFKPAAVDAFNKWQWDGYHSEAHRNEVEIDQDIDLTGVIVRDHGVLSGAS